MQKHDFDEAIETFKDKYGKTWKQSLVDTVYRDCYLNRENSAMVADVIKRLILGAKRPPTASQFKRALGARKRSLKWSGPRQDCETCKNVGIIIVCIYTDLVKRECLLYGEDQPEWYRKLPIKCKQPVTTAAVRCNCGRNRNPEIKTYAEIA